MKVATIGFTKKSARQFFELLRSSKVTRIVDVRLNNASQLAGFAKKNDLAWLAQELCGIEYVHMPSLAPTKALLNNYRKGRIACDVYEKIFFDLMKERRIESTISKELVNSGCLLCSEDQPHNCHRRLVAEYLEDR